MTSRATLELAHHHPGRLRVRSDTLRSLDDAATPPRELDRIRAVLDATEGVRSVRLNTQSGSVVIEYEPGTVDPNTLIEAVARAAELDPPPPDDEGRARRPVGRAVVDAARRLNALTSDLAGGRSDLRDLVPIAMTGFAAYSLFVRKDRLPRWDNLAYWAFSIFQSLHAREIREDEDHAP